MILELGDGRELQLPDAMSDETARLLKRWILTLEERATTAESQVRTLQTEMAALRQTVNTATIDNTATAEAIHAMHSTLAAQLRSVERAVLADRMMCCDPVTGDMTRSRVVRGDA